MLPATTQIEADDVVLAWGHLWMGWNAKAIEPLGESCSNTELFRRLAGAMGLTEPALFDDDETVLRQTLGHKVDLDELRRVGWIRVPYPEDGRAWGAGVFPTASGRIELVSEQLPRLGQPALPTYVPATGGTGRRPRAARPLPAAAADAEAPLTVLELRLLAAPQARSRRGRTVRRARRARRRGTRAWPPGDLARVWNDRASVTVPVKVSARLRPGVVSIPFGWWSAHHPDGRAANALTNDTLTEWGGGVAFWDTLVEVAPA